MKIKLALFAAVGVYLIANGNYIGQLLWILCFFFFLYMQKDEK